MDYVTRGLFRELLDEEWIQGSIPDDVVALADLCNCPVDVMEKSWPVLSRQFIEAAPGRLVNRKLERQRTEDDATL